MFSKTLVVIVSVVFSILMTACGGGGSSDSSGTQTSTSYLTGTAAAGLPIIGTVYLKDVNGNTASGSIAADGTYNIDVDGLTPPIRLKAEGKVAGKNVKYYSYASADDINGTINITPFTDLIIANVAQTLAEDFFDGAEGSLDATELQVQKAELQTKLQNVFTELGVDSSIDLLTTSFSTDHSGLDGALDILRFETDEAANTVTIKNLLNNDEITDNFSDDNNDSTDPLTTPENSGDSLTDMQKIFAQIDTLNGYNGSPTEAQLNALVDDDFLQDDYNKVLFVSEIVTNNELNGVTIQLEVEDINTTSGLANAVLYLYKNSQLADTIPTAFKKNGTTWLLYGNQQIVELQADFVCDKTETESGNSWVSCGAWLIANDIITTNNDSTGALHSAKVYVERNGTIVSDTTVYLQDNDSGELWPYDAQLVDNSIADDYIAFDDRFSLNPANLQVGDQFVFELYNNELNTTDPENPTVSGSVVKTYKVSITQTPATGLSSTSALFPVFSDATKTQLNTFIGGALNINVTNTDDLSYNEVLYYADDTSNQIEESKWGEVSATETFNIDLTSLDLNNANFTQWISAYSKVSDMQTYMSTYQADLTDDNTTAVETLEFTNEMVSGNTVYEVYYDDITGWTISSLSFNANGTGTYAGISGETQGMSLTANWEIVSGNMITSGTFENEPFVNKHIMTAQSTTYITTDCYESTDGISYSECGVDYYFYSLAEAQNFTQQ
ncbi:hypothetical protein [Sulfurimonas sp.]|uniref:hypothetical protein n=1 Tax=Sulfurimonas sp. TaxID=2022749 RepID=UPI003D0B396E